MFGIYKTVIPGFLIPRLMHISAPVFEKECPNMTETNEGLYRCL